MICTFFGSLVSVKKNLSPAGDAKPSHGDAKPSQMLNIMQVQDDGSANLFAVKCDDMSVRFDQAVGKNLTIKCRLFPWHQGERSGLAIKYVSHEVPK